MSEQTSQVGDLEAPPADAFEQSLPVEGLPEVPPLEVLSEDLEVPEPDAIEQLQPAALQDEDDWR